MKTWTLFGAGNLIEDLISAIEANKDIVKTLVINQEHSIEFKHLISSYNIEMIDLINFTPNTDEYLFGFVDPNKELFINGLEKFALKFSNLIHPFSFIPKSVFLGQGNFIGAGVVIGAGSVLNNFNYINRSASIGHHNIIGNFNHIGPGAVVSGRCKIGNKNFLGSGSILKDGISIEHEITIGAGGLVVKDLKAAGVYIGAPVQKQQK